MFSGIVSWYPLVLYKFSKKKISLFPASFYFYIVKIFTLVYYFLAPAWFWYFIIWILFFQVLEVIVSRTNFISSHTDQGIRIIGLSTALANAKDLADWLGIGQMGLFNFRPSVRPVPLECHIAGFPGKHYCPRMATMNKPTFQAIKQHSPIKPALIFVSSRYKIQGCIFSCKALSSPYLFFECFIHWIGRNKWFLEEKNKPLG